MENDINETFHYEMHVYTGLKTNSETKSNVYFVLVGTNGDTGIRRLDDDARKVQLFLRLVFLFVAK